MENKVNVNLNVDINIMSVNDLSLIDAVLDKFGVDGVSKINVDSTDAKPTGIHYTSYPDNSVSLAAPIPTIDVASTETQAAVPTSTTAFTVEDLIKAASPLVNSIGIATLSELLNKYGVVAINQLQPEQCNSFALDLRALGAAI